MVNIIGNVIGMTYTNSIANQPTIQATNIIVSDVTTTTVTFNWTDGNGSSRIVLMKSNSSVDSAPIDGISYSSNTVFGSGSQIGSGNYVVNLGSGPVTVTGLTIGTTYYISVFEFNGVGSSINYLTASPAISSFTSSVDTNSSHQQAFLLIGDSTVAYATDNIPGPTPTANTVYECNGASIVEVGSTDLINAGSAGTGIGSMWPKFGIDYNSGTGGLLKPVFCDSHVFNSNVVKLANGSTTWLYDISSLNKGTCYTNMKAKADSTLSLLSVQKFKAIFLQIGVNDVKDATFTATQINTAYSKLVEYIQADFPGTPIYIVTPSNISTSDTPNALQADTRWHIINTVPSNFSNVYIMYNALHAISLNRQTGAHWDSTMNNYMGSSYARFVLDTETDYDVRRITNMFPIALTETHKSAWKTFIQNSKTNGAWSLLNYLKCDVCSAAQNEPIECIGLTSPYPVNSVYTFQANVGLYTNGTVGNGNNTWYFPTLHTKRGGAEDILAFSKLGANVTMTDYAATLFGSGTSGLLVGKTAPGLLRYKANDATNTDFLSGDVAPRLLNNTWYGSARTGSTKIIYKNSTNFNSVGGLPAGVLNGGAMKRGILLNAKHEAFFVAQYSGFPISSFITDFNNLINILKTP